MRPSPGNQIPISRFDPAAVKLVNNYIPSLDRPLRGLLYGQPANNPDDQWIGTHRLCAQRQAHDLRPLFHLRLHRAGFFDGKNALTTSPNPGNRDRSQTVDAGRHLHLQPDQSEFLPCHVRPARRQPRVGRQPVQPERSRREHVRQHPELHPAHHQQLLQRGLRDLRAGIFQRQYLPGLGRLHVDSRQAPVRIRHRWPQAAVQLAQQPAVQRADHVQRKHDGRCAGGPDDRAACPHFVDGNALSDYMRQTVFAAYAQDNLRLTAI